MTLEAPTGQTPTTKKRGRPKGWKPDPEIHRKPGPKKQQGTVGIGVYLDSIADQDEILAHKVEILALMANGGALNITAAARKLDLSPWRVQHWVRNDPDFKALVRLAQETTADIIEDELAHHANFIPRMMILKGLRPKYRDNYRESNVTEELAKLLIELRKLGQKPSDEPVPALREAEPVELLPQKVTEIIKEPANGD